MKVVSLTLLVSACEFNTHVHGFIHTPPTRWFWPVSHDNRKRNENANIFSSQNEDIDETYVAEQTYDVSGNFHSRRKMIYTSLFMLSTVVPTWAVADERNTINFQDLECGFEIKIPALWEKSVQTLSDRRKIILFLEPNSSIDEEKTLLFLAYTPVRDDFTSLTSFGTVDQVAQMTILPKSAIAGQEAEGTMLLAESKNSAYYFDYTTKVPGQPMRHFRTIFALIQGATGGAGSILLTITAQSTESKYSSVKQIFDDIITSYRKIQVGK